MTVTADILSDSVVPLVDLTEKPEETQSNHKFSDIVDAIVHATVSCCNEHNADNPTEILRCFKQQFVTGRALEVASEVEVNEGETNFIMVDRFKLVETAFDEIMTLPEYRKTLEVQFYGEVCTVLYIT